QIGKETGIVGDNLLNVVKSSEKFMENMRNAGTLTSEMSSNVIGLLAAAEKVGISNQMNQFIEAATNSSKLLSGEIDPKMRNLLFNISAYTSQTEAAISGTMLQSKEGLTKSAKGIENVLRQAGGTTFEAFKTMDPQRKAMINLAAKNISGFQVGELEKMRDSFADMGKITGD